MLVDALHSGRWTVSGAFTGREPYERRFAAAYARYHGIPHCVPTCHGSSALLVALEAIGVDAGSEVLVPGLTWVACASAVAGIGAVPVLVDVDEDTLCMSLDAAKAAMSQRTAAIMLVHLFSSAADLDGFMALSERHRLPLIEDCSQAHGARWRGRCVGSFGRAGAFSFQQTKLLTCGEGGAVITSDPGLSDRMEQLRADGRRYVAQARTGHLDLEEVGAVQGRNYCLSEFHAALLLDGLDRLDEENEVRRSNVRRLEQLLLGCEGVRLQGAPDQLDGRTFYHLCLRIDLDAFGGVDIDQVAAALSAELVLGAVEPVDHPLNRNILYNPLRSPRTPKNARNLFDPSRFDLPTAAQARRTCLTIPHRALLGDPSDMQDIADALDKVRRHARECRREAANA
jgi:dTDP-4-amino-4,6-dideoxygalactose transaminase